MKNLTGFTDAQVLEIGNAAERHQSKFENYRAAFNHFYDRAVARLMATEVKT